MTLLLFKSLLVFALSGVTLLCLRRASASARHLVCLLTLAALLALPLFSVVLPGWHVAALHEEPTPVRPSPALPKGEGKEISQETLSVPAASPSVSSPLGRTPAKSLVTKQGGGFLIQGSEFLALFYLLGLLLASTRPLLGLRGIAHLRRVCVPVSDVSALRVSEGCAAALCLTRLPHLCRADVLVPLTWGWRRPMILLPLGSTEWPEDRLHSVLMHEMAHIKRRDWASHRLADFACALYWFHPLIWLTARRLRAESEMACDDLVLSSGIAAPEYARHLLDIARALPPASRPTQSAAIAMAQTSHIKRRILMVLDKTRNRRTVTRRALLIALVPSAAALLTLAALRPSVTAQAVAAASRDAAGRASVTSLNGGNSPLHFQASRMTFSAFSSSGTQRTDVSARGLIFNGAISQPIASSPDLTINGTELLAGITDSTGPGGKWWSGSGKVLPQPVFDSAAAYSHQATTTNPGRRSLLFAFRLPPSAHDVTANLMTTDGTSSSFSGTWPGKTQRQADYTEASLNPDTGGARVLSATYPATAAKGGLRVGLAFGPWKPAASAKINTHVTDDLISPGFSGNQGNQGFIISPATLTAKGLLLTVATNSTDDIRVVAIGTQGQTLLPADILGESVNSLDQITAHFSQPVSQIKEFRIETRPFQWIEFKNVALQPVK